jgi:hypothetical protein
MDLSRTPHVRIVSRAVVGLAVAMLGVGGSAAGSQPPEPSGLAPSAVRMMLDEHFALEHAADLHVAGDLDPVQRGAWLADHFALEHRADQLAQGVLDPVQRGAWLTHHFAIEHAVDR